jgi:hypothetical protein
MNSLIMQTVRPNLLLAWLWIVVGFAFGAVMGLGFHRDEWLGGYSSLRRRLYRLAHISFFGLAIINMLFALTMIAITVRRDSYLILSSHVFLIGAVSMPLCCILTAHFRRLQALFAVPVISLIVAGVLTLLKVMQP